MAEFKLVVPLEKSVHEDGGWYITGIASGLGVDAQRDNLTSEHIQSFERQIAQAMLPLKNEHLAKDITAEIGEVTKGWITDDFELGVEIKLDQDNPSAQYLWKKLEQGKQFGLSIHGGAKSESKTIDQQGRIIRNLGEIVLDEISVTTRPSYTPSFGTVVRKSLEEAEELQEENQLEDVSKSTEEVTTETQENAGAASTPEATVTESTPVEKSVTTDSKADAKKVAKLVAAVKNAQSLIDELGLDTDTSETVVTPVEKSADEPSDTDFAVTLEKALAAQKADLENAFNAQIEALKELIPGGSTPPVLVAKSDREQLAEALEGASTADRLRVGLKGMYR